MALIIKFWSFYISIIQTWHRMTTCSKFCENWLHKCISVGSFRKPFLLGILFETWISCLLHIVHMFGDQCDNFFRISRSYLVQQANLYFQGPRIRRLRPRRWWVTNITFEWYEIARKMSLASLTIFYIFVGYQNPNCLFTLFKSKDEQIALQSRKLSSSPWEK